MKKIFFLLLAIISICFFNGCYRDNLKELKPQAAACDSVNTITYQSDIKAIIAVNCVSCHSSKGGTQPYFDTYPNLANYSSTELLAVIAPGANKPMPPSSPLSQSDISKVKQWVNGCRPYGKVVVTPCDTSVAMSFSTNIASILTANCTNGCHNNVGLGHSLLTVADVQNDTFIVYHNISSLVYSLIDTIPSRRMPLGRPELSACQIAKIRRWVLEGAKNN
ncbi:MAG: c-type cytochrome [Bacteroidia bacterium]|nr:c-type cytochrome [Bacteroidia bacterium]